MTPFPALDALPHRAPPPPHLLGLPAAETAASLGITARLRIHDQHVLPVEVHRDAVLHPAGAWHGDWRQGGAADASGAFIPASGHYQGPNTRPIIRLPDTPPSPVETLDEAVAWGGFLRAHHGHFMIDGLARLWHRDRAPGLRVAVMGEPETLTPTMWAMLDAAGLPRDALLFLRTPVRVRELVLPSPASIAFRHAAAAWVDTTRRIGALAGPGPGASEQPLYVSRAAFSRTPKVRGTAGEAALERVLRRAGFAVVAPETLPLPDLLARLRDHPVLVGQLGSALHWSVFPPRAPRIIGIVATDVPATYQICDAVIGAEASYLWGRDDRIARPATPPIRPEHVPVALDVGAVLAGLRDLGLVPAALARTPVDGTRAAVEAEYLAYWHRTLGEYAAALPKEPGYAAAAEAVARRLAALDVGWNR